jgi:hypothetical protein
MESKFEFKISRIRAATRWDYQTYLDLKDRC